MNRQIDYILETLYFIIRLEEECQRPKEPEGEEETFNVRLSANKEADRAKYDLVMSAVESENRVNGYLIIPIVAVVFVAVAVVILVAKKKKTIENSAPIQAPTSSLTTAESVPVKSPASTQATEGALFCHMCGTRLPAGSDFCYKCGAKVIKE